MLLNTDLEAFATDLADTEAVIMHACMHAVSPM